MENFGKFIIGNSSSLQIEDISKEKMICSFHSLLNYRIIGDANSPNALDPSEGPFIGIGFQINDFKLENIYWDTEKKVYLLTFKK